MNTETIKRLKEYVYSDNAYITYKKGKLENPSDFEVFCFQHCEDIENLLESFEKNLDCLREERHNKEILIEEINDLNKKIDKYEDFKKQLSKILKEVENAI